MLIKNACAFLSRFVTRICPTNMKLGKIFKKKSCCFFVVSTISQSRLFDSTRASLSQKYSQKASKNPGKKVLADHRTKEAIGLSQGLLSFRHVKALQVR